MNKDPIFQPGVKHLLRHTYTVAALGGLFGCAFVALAYRNIVWIRGGPQLMDGEDEKHVKD